MSVAQTSLEKYLVPRHSSAVISGCAGAQLPNNSPQLSCFTAEVSVHIVHITESRWPASWSVCSLTKTEHCGQEVSTHLYMQSSCKLLSLGHCILTVLSFCFQFLHLYRTQLSCRTFWYFVLLFATDCKLPADMTDTLSTYAHQYFVLHCMVNVCSCSCAWETQHSHI